jgi:hypothetical protein
MRHRRYEPLPFFIGENMSIKLTTHLFGIALALLPLGLLVTIITRQGGWFAAALIIAVEVVLGSILFTVYRIKMKK